MNGRAEDYGDAQTPLIPVVLAGGSGTRLWPASRRLRPKQFLSLGEEGESLLQTTLQRLQGLTQEAPILVCSEQHRFLAAEQLRKSGLEGTPVLLEPEGRNTAASVALAALFARKATDRDPLLLVLPSDHIVQDAAGFHSAVEAACPYAEQGRLVTFGIKPRHAETGYGYIEVGKPLGEAFFEVARFVEKPDKATAERFVEAGTFLWNSGMFVLKSSSYLAELDRYEPAILEACRESLAPGPPRQDPIWPFVRPDPAAFLRSPSRSLDTAVMEPTHQAVVLPLDLGWSDVGSWASLWEAGERDDDGNRAQGDVLLQDVQNCLISSDQALVACIGLEHLVVVATPDAVLVADRGRAQEVQEMVATLSQQGRPECDDHRQVFRPWGRFDTVDRGERYLVKRITVNPGARLSLQYHHHRAEHWVVVSGVAHVRNGSRNYVVRENESTFIPARSVHSLENRGDQLLELIEIQSGSYVGEDDIVRLEDLYGREDAGDV